MSTPKPARKPRSDADAERESQATELVHLALSHCLLVHDENLEVYAMQRSTGEVRHVGRRAFKHWLTSMYYDAEEKAPRGQSVSEAIATLEGIGRHKSGQGEVYVRCGRIFGAYVIDLAEQGNSRAIRVKPGKWTVESTSGLFIRPESLQPLPAPIRGGDINELWKLVNVPEPSRLLVLTWLLDCLRPDTPFPLLEVIGEQGSAKSLTQELLRALIDPSSLPLRNAPKNSEDVYVGAANGYLLAYDNVSHLSPEMQDTFCRVAYGVPYTTRRMHTNGEEFSVRAARPVSINGISACVTAQDLVDRTLSIEPECLTTRIERSAIESAFHAAHPGLLGALLDVFASALVHLPDIEIPESRRPRLIEFAKLGCAVARALALPSPDEAFLSAWETHRADAIARTIDASPVATALLDWLQADVSRYGEHTIKHLFSVAEGWKPQGCDAWPKSAKGFADALRRVAPALRFLGIEVSRGRKSNGQTWLTIAKKSETKVTEVSEVTAGGVPHG